MCKKPFDSIQTSPLNMDATGSFKRQYFSAKTPRYHIVKVCSVRLVILPSQYRLSLPCARSRRVWAVGRVSYVIMIRQATGSDTFFPVKY